MQSGLSLVDSGQRGLDLIFNVIKLKFISLYRELCVKLYYIANILVHRFIHCLMYVNVTPGCTKDST